MAGESPEVEADASAEFAGRRALWAAGAEPVDEAGRWALDRAVAASLRIERCERALDGLTTLDRRRARLAWDQDRAVEAEEIAARLGKEPGLTSRRLQATRAGAEWLIMAWLGLLDTLDAGSDWSEAEASMALDLLGVPSGRRGGADPGDAPGGPALVATRRALAVEEVGRLEALRDEVLDPLDQAERDLAEAGDLALLSKPARLILRYERDAWRRFREAIRPAPAPTPPTPPVVAPPEPVDGRPTGARDPRPTPIAPSPGFRSFGEERQALLAEVAACGFEIPEWSGPIPVDDDSAWLDEVERRVEARGPIPAAPGPNAAPARDGTNPISPGTIPPRRPGWPA